MYINDDLLSLELARDRASGRLTRRPPGFDTKAALSRLEQQMTARIDGAVEALQRDTEVATAQAALGSEVLIPYGTYLKANGISYDLGQRLREEGKLKVLKAGGKLVVRLGHAKEFVRKLPLER